MPEAPAIPLLRWDDAPALGAEVAVTTRHGGRSVAPYDTLNLGLHVGDDPAAVVENRARAAGGFGASLDDLVFARQVHGATATVVGAEDRGRGTRSEDDALPHTDIVVTTSHRLTLAILVADCLPLALVDPAAGVLAAVHAGWRGTA
ncbi:MAG: laccase domain-containing protein, partial [Acidimicrobiales bacterium]